MYARAYVEGRLTEKHLENFRHELRDHPGLSSYPHPWLMPDFWQFPTVSMGLGPINALYQARFMRYLENRGLIPKTPRKVWAFLGDGETDEPESLGALTLGSREKLDNLIFVVNCNLQRLDGPVRGNGNIVSELEAVFRGAGWNVIKCLWGGNWDELFERDTTGLLLKRMEECVDGEFQNFKAKGGAYVRKHFFGKYPELLELVKDYTDEQLQNLRRGGHDPQKVYNAYLKAVNHKGAPTVILAKTVKGYGLGEGGEGRNATHQQKKLTEPQVTYVHQRFEMDIPEEAVKKLEFVRPAEGSPEAEYIKKRIEAMGGPLPQRFKRPFEFKAPALDSFKDAVAGSGGRAASTTSAFVGVLKSLLKSDLAKYVVPIIPDEARTFGMDSLFTQIGIYASQGQLYTPVDKDMVLYYKEAKGRPDPGRGHQRGRVDGEYDGSGYRVFELRRPDDSVLRVLLDVRLPAHRRPHLGVRGFARQGLSWWAERQDERRCWRGIAAPGRSQPVMAAPCRPAFTTTRRSRTRSRSSCRTAFAACTRIAKTASIT
jgi:pyruvate dehydrogenase E1 component